MIKKLTLGLALASAASVAVAQDRRPEYGPSVNIAAAKKIAAGVLAECAKNGWNVAVAVVDTHGFLVYFERMENTQTASMDIEGRSDLPPPDARVHGSDQQGAGDRDSAGRLRIPGRQSDHGRRQGHRRGRRERRHRRPGRAMR